MDYREISNTSDTEEEAGRIVNAVKEVAIMSNGWAPLSSIGFKKSLEQQGNRQRM